MKKRILSNVLLFLALTMMVGCGMITPQVRKDIPYGKSIEFDKAFDCAISAARDIGFTQIEFPDRKTGTFSAMKTGGTAFSAMYQANFVIDKNTSAISVTIQEFNAPIPSSEVELNKIIDAFYNAFQKHCGK